MRSMILPERADPPMICSVFPNPAQNSNSAPQLRPILDPNPLASRETVTMHVVLRVFRAGQNRAADTADHLGRFRSVLRILLT